MMIKEEKEFTSIIEQQQHYLPLCNDAYNMQYIKPYLNIMYPAMYATFYSCTWFQREETVMVHIEAFLQEIKDAIIAFKNNQLKENK